MATASTNKDKDVIYVDIDDEITTVIDKVRSSEGRVVALVLPKRATVLQSIVNMKLLKRSAEQAKKHLVLITTESGLMSLAGSVGLHVAATPQSKPEVPAAKAAVEPEAVTEAEESETDGQTDAAYTRANAGDRPVGELAAAAGSESAIETLQLPEDAEEAPAQAAPVKSKKPAKDKSLKVPSFNKFRLGLFLGIVLLALIGVGLYFAAVVLPKATIAIATQSSGQNVSLALTLNPATQTLDTTNLVVPAKAEQQQKTSTQQVNTTGQQNNGTATTGTVTMSAQECGVSNPFVAPADIPAGTGISTSGLTFITQADTAFTINHAKPSGSNCYTYPAISDTAVTAQSAGAKYNVSNATFTVAGRSDVTATGSTSGGTDNVIQIVAQADIDNAKQKLGAPDTSTVQASLEQTLTGEGMYPLPATFAAGTPTVTTSNNVGDQASSVTVTQAITYTMYGVKQSDLDTLITGAVGKQVNMQNQSILQDGLSSATFSVTGTANNSDQVTLQTTATVGPAIRTSDIERQVAGKKIGDVKTLINAIPGVTSVEIHLSPFWVSTVPTNLQKVTVTISGAK